MHFIHSLLLLLLCDISAAVSGSTTSTAAASQSTACGTIVNSKESYLFNASLVYECLTSVPFYPDVATRFLAYYNDTLQFQSTLSYLKNPPPSYQQPAVDLIGGLNHLQREINEGFFTNQYEFEDALQALIYSAHDTNLNLYAGILNVFSFASPFDIISVSIDGIQLPKVYLAKDSLFGPTSTKFQASAIATINGVDAVTYLSQFATQNSIGTLEPHTDWNQLMLSPAAEIRGIMSTFSGGASFYPGDEIIIVLENGTEIRNYFQAIYNNPFPTGPLETGGDFYNFFVLGHYPASFNPCSDGSCEETDPDGINNPDGKDDIKEDDGPAGDVDTFASPDPSSATTSDARSTAETQVADPSTTPLSWLHPAYPEIPDVAQPDLGTFGEGYVSGTGYFLNSSLIAVLSIPSFNVFPDSVGTFQSTISEFLSRSKAAGLKKIVIDIQQNSYGHPLLAIDTFKQFFPNIDPFVGSRMCAHPYANLTGNAISSYNELLDTSDGNYYKLAGSEWVSEYHLNANTNEDFKDWAELFDPVSYNGDNFTTAQRYNLSSSLFDQSSTHDEFWNFTVYGYEANYARPNASPPFASEDIIILSDGMCASACAVFAEAMNHEAGVRIVVAGGRPVSGPMQAPSGSRGARLYDIRTLDLNIQFAQEIMAALPPLSTDLNSLPNRTEDHGILITAGSVNLRDQVRSVEDMIPLQFAYEAADCRIWFTPQTVYNYTALWLYAADAIWSKPSLCVAGSLGFATTGTNRTNFVGPSCNTSTSPCHNPSTNASFQSFIIPTSPYNKINETNVLSRSALSLGPLVDSIDRFSIAIAQPRRCKSNKSCKSGYSCNLVPTCLDDGTINDTLQCVPGCTREGSPCAVGGHCVLIKPDKPPPVVGSTKFYTGYCVPSSPVNSIGGKCGVTETGEINVGFAPPNKRGQRDVE